MISTIPAAFARSDELANLATAADVVVAGEFGRIASIAAAMAAVLSALAVEILEETEGREAKEVLVVEGMRVKEVLAEAGREWRPMEGSNFCFSKRLLALPQLGRVGACVVGEVGFEIEFSVCARVVPRPRRTAR